MGSNPRLHTRDSSPNFLASQLSRLFITEFPSKTFLSTWDHLATVATDWGPFAEHAGGISDVPLLLQPQYCSCLWMNARSVKPGQFVQTDMSMSAALIFVPKSKRKHINSAKRLSGETADVAGQHFLNVFHQLCNMYVAGMFAHARILQHIHVPRPRCANLTARSEKTSSIPASTFWETPFSTCSPLLHCHSGRRQGPLAGLLPQAANN